MKKKNDMDYLTQKHLLYKQFGAWVCDGCSIAPLTDYICNPIYQELIDEDQYSGNDSDEKLYLDLWASSGYTSEAEKLERNDSKINLGIFGKNPATKKVRLRIWARSVGEYLYMFTKSGLTLRHKTYSISQQDEDFLE